MVNEILHGVSKTIIYWFMIVHKMGMILILIVHEMLLNLLSLLGWFWKGMGLADTSLPNSLSSGPFWSTFSFKSCFRYFQAWTGTPSLYGGFILLYICIFSFFVILTNLLTFHSYKFFWLYDMSNDDWKEKETLRYW